MTTEAALDVYAPLIRASVYKRAATGTWTFVLPVTIEAGYVKRPDGRVLASFVGAAVHVHLDTQGYPDSLGVGI